MLVTSPPAATATAAPFVAECGRQETVQLNGAEGIVRAGGNGQDGTLVVRNAANIDAIAITGDSAGAAGVYLGDGAGNAVIELLDVGDLVRKPVRNLSLGEG